MKNLNISSQNRIDEICALLGKLKEHVSKNIVTDETKKIFAELKTLWFENFPDFPTEEDEFYYQLPYKNWYPKPQGIPEEERELFCLIHDWILEVDCNQVEEFKDKLHENYRGVIERLFDMYDGNREDQLSLISGLFATDDEEDDCDMDCDNEIIYFQFLSIERYNGSFSESVFPTVEQAEILQALCSSLAVPNDFDKVDMELLRQRENGTMALTDTNNNYHVYYKTQSDAKKKIVAHIKNNQLSEKQIDSLFSIVRKTFLHDYTFEEDSTEEDEWIWKPFFALLPMSIRNAMLEPTGV